MKGFKFLIVGLITAYDEYHINNRTKKNYKALVAGIRRNTFMFQDYKNCIRGTYRASSIGDGEVWYSYLKVKK